MYNLLILKTGRTFPELAARRGDFEDWFTARLSAPGIAPHGGLRISVIDAQAASALPPVSGIDGIVVTGSPQSVHEEEPWSVRAGEWLSSAALAGAPMLGVCYGHQLLAHATGGRSGQNPAGREIGVVEVAVLQADPLFTDLPPRFPVFTTHCDAVLVAPPQARVLAGNAHTGIQALALGERARTVQWHPEFDVDVMRHYLLTRAAMIDEESGPGTTERLLTELRQVPSGDIVLRNFINYCVRR